MPNANSTHLFDVGEVVAERFEIRRKLGQGGRGVVYEAWDRELDSSVALKTLQRADPSGLHRFKNEFRAAEDIRHPNVVQLGELFAVADTAFFSMELLQGQTFIEYVQRLDRGISHSTSTVLLNTLGLDHETGDEDLQSGAGSTADRNSEDGTASTIEARLQALDERRLRQALLQLGRALQTFHEHGRVHRDVKPSNVLITDDQRLVLLDFGFAQSESLGLTDDSFVGTVQYMAPEQAGQSEVTPAADIYAIGVMLYEAMTGRYPFSGNAITVSLAKRMSPPERIPILDEHGPRDLVDLCWQMLAVDPAQRPTALDLVGMMGESASTPDPRTEVFVGRDAHLQALDALTAPWSAGRACGVVVRGGAGVGKTTLLAHFRQTRRLDEDALVLSSRCFERESLPFKAFDGALNELTAFLMRRPALSGRLSRPLRRVGRLFPVVRMLDTVDNTPTKLDVLDSKHLRNEAFAALARLLREVSEHIPLVILVDDIQWADADSLQLMEFIWNRVHDAPLMLLMTARPDVSVGDDTRLRLDRLSETASLPGLQLLDLAGLTPDESRALVRKLAGIRDAAKLARLETAAVDQAHGHPLFLHELVRHSADENQAGEGPTDLLDALAHRMGRLDEKRRELIALLAVAGVPLPRSIAAEAASMTQSACFQAIEALRIGQFVRRVEEVQREEKLELFHDRVREATLRELDDASTSELHERLADALSGSEFGREKPHLLVYHLRSAGRDEEAAEQAIRGARRAEDALAFAQAASLYQAAIELTGDAQSLELRRRRADCLTNAGHSLGAGRAHQDIAERVAGEERQTHLRKAAEQLISGGEVESGGDLLSRMLDEARISLPSTRLGTLARIVYNRLAHGLMTKVRGEVPPDPSGNTPRLERRLQLYAIVSRRMALIDSLGAFEVQTRELIDAYRAGDHAHYAIALAADAGFRGSYGNPGNDRRARAQLALARRLTDQLDHDEIRPDILLLEGIAAHTFGEFERALTLCDEAEKQLLDTSIGQQYKLNTARLFQCYALREIGQLDILAKRVREFREDARLRGDQFTYTTMGRGFIETWLAEDDVEGAARTIEDATWTPSGDEFHLQHWYELRARAQLALYSENLGVFDEQDWRADFERTIGSRLAQAIQAARAEALWLQGRMALAAGPGQRDITLARRSHRRLAAEKGRAYIAPWALALRAAIEMADGDDSTAADTLDTLVDQARSAELELLGACAALRRALLAGQPDSEARDAVASCGIQEPERFMAMYFPR